MNPVELQILIDKTKIVWYFVAMNCALKALILFSCMTAIAVSTHAVETIKLGPALQCKLGYLDDNNTFQLIPKSTSNKANPKASPLSEHDQFILDTFTQQIEDPTGVEKLQCFTDKALIKKELVYQFAVPSKAQPFHRYQFELTMSPLDFYPMQSKDQKLQHVFPSTKYGDISALLKYFVDTKALNIQQHHVVSANSDPTISAQDRVIEEMKPTDFQTLDSITATQAWSASSRITEFSSGADSVRFFKSVQGGFAIKEPKKILYHFLDAKVPKIQSEVVTITTIRWALSCEIVFKPECYKKGITQKDNVEAIQNLMFHM
jgi:hypothetical protein